VPFFFALKYGILMFYFFAFAIFVASLSGYYFLPEPAPASPSGKSKALVVFCSLFLLGQIACFAPDLIPNKGYFLDLPINRQLVIAERINKLITEQGLSSVGIDDRIYDDDQGRLTLVSQTDYTYRVLCQYAYPQLRSRFTPAPNLRLQVLVWPSWANGRPAVPPLYKLDDFAVGRLRVEIYRQ
jgi:hypothetical protein